MKRDPVEQSVFSARVIQLAAAGWDKYRNLRYLCTWVVREGGYVAARVVCFCHRAAAVLSDRVLLSYIELCLRLIRTYVAHAQHKIPKTQSRFVSSLLILFSSSPPWFCLLIRIFRIESALSSIRWRERGLGRKREREGWVDFFSFFDTEETAFSLQCRTVALRRKIRLPGEEWF